MRIVVAEQVLELEVEGSDELVEELGKLVGLLDKSGVEVDKVGDDRRVGLEFDVLIPF